MRPVNYKDAGPYIELEILGTKYLFADNRIDRKSLPEGIYAYSIRHDDNGNPCSIEPSVVVNFYGTILTNKDLKLNHNDGINFTDADWGFIDCPEFINIEEFFDNMKEGNKMAEESKEVKFDRAIYQLTKMKKLIQENNDPRINAIIGIVLKPLVDNIVTENFNPITDCTWEEKDDLVMDGLFLEELSKDPDWKIRYSIAFDGKYAEKLINDENSIVRHTAEKRLEEMRKNLEE